jgi:hypothetical protein
VDKIHQLIAGAKSVALCTEKIEDNDLANSIIALTKFLQNSGKAVGVILKEIPGDDIMAIFDARQVVYTDNATPLRYVVSINYGKSAIEKVLHDVDEVEKKVKFYIVPAGKKFDFEDVEYSQEGNDYDLTITVGIKSFQQMGKIYENADYLFRDNKVISIARGVDSLGDELIAVGDHTNYSVVVRNLIGEQMDEEIREILVEAFTQDLEILEGGVDNSKLKELFDTAGDKFDINEVLQKNYFSKSYKNLDLQIKLMTNIRVDKEARAIWSIVSNDDMKFAGVDRKSLDTKGRILFNISSDFDIAIAAYEVERTLFKVVVESNNPAKYSAQNLAGVFEGRGNDRHATFVMKDTPRKDFEKNLFIVLDNLYGIKIEVDGHRETAKSAPKAEVYGKYVPVESTEIPLETVVNGNNAEEIGQESLDIEELPLTEPVVNGKNIPVNSTSDLSAVDNTQKVQKRSEYDDLLD